MEHATLLVGASLSFGSALAYAYAGRKLSARMMTGPAGGSWRLFLTWWFAVAAVAFVSGVLQVLGAAGITDLELFLVGQLVSLLLVCIAHFGLVYYLVTLFTGRWGAWRPLLVFYIAFYLILLYDLSAGDPGGVEVGRWRTGFAYSSALTPVLSAAIYSLLIIPPLLGSIAYGALYFRAREASSRFRILLVSMSIFLWATVSVLIALPTWQHVDAIQFGARLVGTLLAFVIVAAYYPPQWIQRRWGVHAVSASA